MMVDEALLLSQNNTINDCNKYGKHNNKLIIGFDLEWRDPQLGMYSNYKPVPVVFCSYY